MFASRQVCYDGLIIGPGESAFKKSRGVDVNHACIKGMYAFWECRDVHCENVSFLSSARACSWYGSRHVYRHCQIKAPKMFRELKDLTIEDVRIDNGAEFFWKCKKGRLTDVVMRRAEYAFLHAEDLQISNLQLQGKYIFQYAKHIELHNTVLTTKDAFWESENCVVYDSVIDGEYVGWYSRNLRLVRCHISGTQPLCYCKNLILEDCTFDASADRCFEHSSVCGTIIGSVTSITPPMKGQIVYK